MKNTSFLCSEMPSTRRQKVKARKSRELDMLSDIENMDILIGNSDTNSIERELRNVYDGSVETNRDHDSNERNTQGSSSQANEFRNIHDVHVGRENSDRDNLETLSSELNDRISREINGLIGTVNVQIQRTVEEAICRQVLPQVQNVLREVQNRDAFGPETKRDQNRDLIALTARNKGKSTKTIRT